MHYNKRRSQHCFYLRERGNKTSSRSDASTFNLASQKLWTIKSRIKAGMYESDDKIRITAVRLLKFLKST
ncbi:MAG: hypothetical protein HY811_09895 [Planctomycetes bacterium]|nr:hypothetical protein [Planctomycetota bacterium]